MRNPVVRSHPKIYDSIGNQYAINRVPDPRIAEQIWQALGDAKTVCNIGAGSGSYEPTDREVVAVEPSQKMIGQRTSQNRVIQATAEDLPFDDRQFDASMTVLSIHHWRDPEQGIREMQRVSKRQVVFTFDPDQTDCFWLVRDYVPEIFELDRKRTVTIANLKNWLQTEQIQTVMIPHDCTDGFQAAYWRRPQKYLDPDVQRSISSLAQLPQEIVSNAMKRLAIDLESGAWHDRYATLIERTEMDFGYRLVVSD